MQGTHIIEVAYRPGVTDPVGAGLYRDAVQMGLKRVKRAASSQLYRLVGQLNLEDRSRIARDLLTDSITQTYHDGAAIPARKKMSRTPPQEWVIDVWYKPGVTDVAGESVLKGVQDLGITSVTEVRTGMRYRLRGLSNPESADKVALALLMNPLVQDRYISASADPPERNGGHAD